MKRLAVIPVLWMLSFLACAAVVALLFIFVDVPTALHFWKIGRVLRPLGGAFATHVVVSGEAAVILTTGVVRLVRGQLSPLVQTLAVACLTSLCAYVINDFALKILFGVPIPANVVHGARHAFHFWMGSESSSFPSGHMVLAGAFAGVFMRYGRATVWPLAALLLLAGGLLIVGGWHFVSDVVAGAFIGISAGILAGEAQVAATRETQP